MSKFLSCKAVVVTQIIICLAACTSQTALDNFEMANLESTKIEFAADTRVVLEKVDDHQSAPSTHAAIGEFADLLRGEPLDLGYEKDIQ
jgi:hypothetical protein